MINVVILPRFFYSCIFCNGFMYYKDSSYPHIGIKTSLPYIPREDDALYIDSIDAQTVYEDWLKEIQKKSSLFKDYLDELSDEFCFLIGCTTEEILYTLIYGKVPGKNRTFPSIFSRTWKVVSVEYQAGIDCVYLGCEFQ